MDVETKRLALIFQRFTNIKSTTFFFGCAGHRSGVSTSLQVRPELSDQHHTCVFWMFVEKSGH